MGRPTLLFQAPVGTRSGYGDHARDLLTSLIKMDKFEIMVADLRWGGTPRNALKAGIPEHDEIIKRFVRGKLEKRPNIHIHVTVPNEFQPIAEYNIGITAGIETTLCAPPWIEGINKMNMIIVPSIHARNSLAGSTWTKTDNKTKQPVAQLKVERPIEVLFEGVDLKLFGKSHKKEKSIQETLAAIPENFNFLFVGHWLKGKMGEDRKDIGMMVKVFLESFKGQKNMPGMILKTSGATFSVMDKNDIFNKINSIKQSIKEETPNIYLIHGELSTEEMNTLYNHSKVKAHITFTKGEGFGRPLLEASLSGKPIIASGWSGHVDFLNKNLSLLLPGELKNVHESAAWENVILKESKWFTINYSYASAAMKEVVKNYQKYKLNAGKLATINTKFSLEKMQTKFEEILNQYLPEFPEEVELTLPNLPDAGPALPKFEKVSDLPEEQGGKDLDAEEPAAGSDPKPILPPIIKASEEPLGAEDDDGE